MITIYIHTYIRTYIHSFIHSYLHTYLHTYVRTYVHTYIHIRIYIYTTCTSMIPVCNVETALPGHAHHMNITALSHVQAAAEATSAAPTESLSAATYSGAGSADRERRIRRGAALASFVRTFKHRKLLIYHKIKSACTKLALSLAMPPKEDALQFEHGSHLVPWSSLRTFSPHILYIERTSTQDARNLNCSWCTDMSSTLKTVFFDHSRFLVYVIFNSCLIFTHLFSREVPGAQYLLMVLRCPL